MSFLNHVVEFCRVIASSVGASNGATLYNVAGIAGFATDEDGAVTGEDTSDDGGEQAHEQEVYGALGVIGRPLPPEGDAFTEALAVRTDDGLVPYAFRDLRLHRALNPGGGGVTPREGQLMFVGYRGAFLSHSLTTDKSSNVTVLYCPYDFDGQGVAQKAHAIILDPTEGNRAISIVHGSGVFVTLSEDTGSGPGIVASVDGSTFLRMSPGELSVSAEKILLKGNVYVGRAAEAGIPLQGGPISPPCPSLFVSPV